MNEKNILEVAILGAGFISDYHLDAISADNSLKLVAICDLNYQAAFKLASKVKGVNVYDDLDKMLDENNLDVVHILTQPDSHYVLAKKVVESGTNVLMEKPITVNSKEAEDLRELAKQYNVSVAINHNFIFSNPYQKLKKVIQDGELGEIKSIHVVWKKKLAQAEFGPWNLWMLKEPGNILFETGAHSISELLGVSEVPKIIRVLPTCPQILPTGSIFYNRWIIIAQANNTLITIESSFDLGYDQHYIELDGQFGIVKADIENDVFIHRKSTGRAYDLERLHANLNEGISKLRQAISTYNSYAFSKFNKSYIGGPYDVSMYKGILNSYAQIRKMEHQPETSIDFSINVTKTLETIRKKMPKNKIVSDSVPIPVTSKLPTKNARVLLVGGTGFIGKEILKSLQNKNIETRVLVRNSSSMTGFKLLDTTELIQGDYRDVSLMDKVLDGIDTVIHLAVAHGSSLNEYLTQDSIPTIKFAEQCQQHNIKKFIYTGTIDSLNLAEKHTISEKDGVDSGIKTRNNYAHSKAITEKKLNRMHKDTGFPVIIFRPSIVIGSGGPIMHVGIANWSALNQCTYWGKGKNKIPFVLVEDIANAITTAIETSAIEGMTFNLSSPSMISAADYVRQIEKGLNIKISAKPSNPLKFYLGDTFKWIVKLLVNHPDKTRRPSLHDWKCRGQYADFDCRLAKEKLNWEPEQNKEKLLDDILKII